METKNALVKPIDYLDDTYHPSAKALKTLVEKMFKPVTRRAIIPGRIARTDGLPVNQTISDLENLIQALPENSSDRTKVENLLSRIISVSDLTENLYQRFAENKNSMYNWFKEAKYAIDNTLTELKYPKTKILRLPIELAQFIRLEYQETSKEDREFFNDYIFQQFGLEDGKTYFIKTGTFSSKFQFANAKCSEPREMGEYFQVINNFAMLVGAGDTIDLVVREYIEDVEGNPTIYNGMPLRTEFRAFVDCDKNEVIGIVPYWNLHYYIQDERASNILSIIVRGNLFLDQVFEDYLKCDFAIVNSDGSKVLSGVRLFEGEIPEVQSILKQIVIPYYQQY